MASPPRVLHAAAVTFVRMSGIFRFFFFSFFVLVVVVSSSSICSSSIVVVRWQYSSSIPISCSISIVVVTGYWYCFVLVARAISSRSLGNSFRVLRQLDGYSVWAAAHGRMMDQRFMFDTTHRRRFRLVFGVQRALAVSRTFLLRT